MRVQRTIKVPVHYDATRPKKSILDNLTARLTYCIRLISELITEDTRIDRKTIRDLVHNSDIAEKTGLSAGFIDPCIDKVIWSWKSYHKLLKREPRRPSFEDKTSCRFDYRTGKVEMGKGKFSPLWIHISTLEKRKTIDIPLNPSQYHLNQFKNAEINDFEIIKRNKKYYVHVSITKVVEDKPISSIGGIDAIIASLQEVEKWDKLRELRNKRANVSTYYDWCLASEVAEFTEGSMIAIGNTPFRQTQIRGNDADFNAVYNISYRIEPVAIWVYNNSIERYDALRCRDDRLKAGMNMEEIHASL